MTLESAILSIIGMRAHEAKSGFFYTEEKTAPCSAILQLAIVEHLSDDIKNSKVSGTLQRSKKIEGWIRRFKLVKSPKEKKDRSN